MTGGGFGGCVVALLPATEVARVQGIVARHYRSPQGESAQVYVCRACAGAASIH